MSLIRRLLETPLPVATWLTGGFVVGMLAGAVAMAAGVAAGAGWSGEPRVLRVCRPSPAAPCTCIDSDIVFLGNEFGDVACVEVKR